MLLLWREGSHNSISSDKKKDEDERDDLKKKGVAAAARGEEWIMEDLLSITNDKNKEIE